MKGVSMETVTALDEIIVKVLSLSMRTEAETVMFFLLAQRQALADLAEWMTQISFQLKKLFSSNSVVLWAIHEAFLEFQIIYSVPWKQLKSQLIIKALPE